MKTQVICFMCKGTKIIERKDNDVYSFCFGKKIIKETCDVCEGTGRLDEYICKRCGHRHTIWGSHYYTEQCENCYAEIETGKYLEDFFYIAKPELKELSSLVNDLLKEGYMPIGRPLSRALGWTIQAVIKKEYIQK